jgi:hypothetical protein
MPGEPLARSRFANQAALQACAAPLPPRHRVHGRPRR